MKKEFTLENIKAVIFDMDGTLIDTEKYYRKYWPKACEEFGYHMTDEQALSLRSLGQPFAPLRFKEMFGEDFDYEAVRARRKELIEEVLAEKGIELKPGAIEVLTGLKEKGICRAVATANDMERAERYLERIGLKDYFDKIISAHQVKEGKPSPDVYEFACQQLGFAPEECIAVEDSPNGVKSAHGAGCVVVMIPDQDQPDEELLKVIDYKLNSLFELLL